MPPTYQIQNFKNSSQHPHPHIYEVYIYFSFTQNFHEGVQVEVMKYFLEVASFSFCYRY